MARVVVDASVVVKWFLEEDHSAEARALRDDHLSDVILAEAPAVMPFEVLNAARYSGALDRTELARVAEALGQASIAVHDLRGDFAAKTVSVALSAGLSVYDASYVALAQLLDVPLYTADEEMVRVSKGHGIVRHVREYSTPES